MMFHLLFRRALLRTPKIQFPAEVNHDNHKYALSKKLHIHSRFEIHYIIASEFQVVRNGIIGTTTMQIF